MRKRILSLAMTLALGLGPTVPALAAGNAFTDVAAGSPYYQAIQWAVERGIAKGTSATAFSPADTCTTAQILTFLYRANGSPASSFPCPFAGVPASSPYYPALCWASEKAILAGQAPAAGTPCTRAAAVTYLWRAAGNPEPATAPDFDDVDRDADYSAAVAWAVEKGVTKGTAAATFSPDSTCTRGQIVTFLYRAQNGESSAAQPAASSAVSRTAGTYSVASGSVTADVITVDTADASVKVKVAMVNNTLGATAGFGSIAASSGAKVVVNGNFFESYQDFKIPIGYVMADGQFLYGVSGLTSFGFTDGGEIRVGRPSVFFFVEGGGNSWACYECNSPNGQGYDTSVVYTPAYGRSVTFTTEGLATTVSGGVIQGSQNVSAGGSLAIPADGYVMFFGPGFTSTDYYRAPQAGTSVKLEARSSGTGAAFSLDGVTGIVTGAPCLVENGALCTRLDDGFSEARFTTSSTPRTAIGRLADGRLVIVSTGAATIQQLRELMAQLGCTDAVNLDGGASTALAVDGKVVRAPGRQLTTTLQIFAG